MIIFFRVDRSVVYRKLLTEPRMFGDREALTEFDGIEEIEIEVFFFFFFRWSVSIRLPIRESCQKYDQRSNVRHDRQKVRASLQLHELDLQSALRDELL